LAADYLDALKRITEWLEDAHVLYDLIFDDQLTERASDFPNLILPDVRRLSAAEVAAVQQHVDGGGSLLVSGATGTMDADGGKTDPDALFTTSTGKVYRWESTDWQPITKTIGGSIEGEPEMPVYPHLPDAPEGRDLMDTLEGLCDGYWLRTDAPWWVRTRIWRAQEINAIPVHWINYRQDEMPAVETPIPMGPINADLLLPDDVVVDRVEWIFPEMKKPLELKHEVSDNRVSFQIPRLVVYGISVIHLK
jgi:hypothetical protein